MVFGDIEEAMQATKLKMENPVNSSMEPFRKLRS
jgi:hypothetical protein